MKSQTNKQLEWKRLLDLITPISLILWVVSVALMVLLCVLICMYYQISFYEKKYLLGSISIGLSIFLGSLSVLVSLCVFLRSSKNSDEILKITKMKNRKVLEEHGFYPLIDENADKNGFELFEDEICNLVGQAENSIKLCIVTPLLHSLRMPWNYGYRFDFADHWAKKFCAKFLEKIKMKTKVMTEGKFDVQFLYLNDETLEKIVKKRSSDKNIIQWKVDDKQKAREGYKNSIDAFFDDFGAHDCVLDKQQTSDIPVYFAVIDSGPNNTSGINKGQGVMSFFDINKLLDKQNESGTFDKIAEDFQAFGFTQPQIVQYFDNLFNTLRDKAMEKHKE